jgi:hypothetical protein
MITNSALHLVFSFSFLFFGGNKYLINLFSWPQKTKKKYPNLLRLNRGFGVSNLTIFWSLRGLTQKKGKGKGTTNVVPGSPGPVVLPKYLKRRHQCTITMKQRSTTWRAESSCLGITLGYVWVPYNYLCYE